jgi:hypothetical protein
MQVGASNHNNGQIGRASTALRALLGGIHVNYRLPFLLWADSGRKWASSPATIVKRLFDPWLLRPKVVI